MTGQELGPAAGTVDRAGVAAIQGLVRGLLVELDRVASLAGVPYFLAYGTALGAVRDGDLIPWDVDADVWLAHEHYARFVGEVAALLGPDYELLTPETHDDYEYLFPRLVLRSVHHVFVRVDVFPLDPAPTSRRLAAAYVAGMHLLAQVLFVKRARTDVRKHYSAGKRLLTRLLRAVARPVPDRVLIRVFRRLQASGRPDSPLVANSCGSYGAREVFAREWFAGATAYDVFGRALPLPGDADAVLTQVYGDYRTPVDPGRQHDELVHATASFVRPLQEQGVLA
ncbi:LicD family protein [Nocardioides dilutus]